MGAQKDRSRRFLESHPVCCFCGGTTPATTQDHIPSRALFHNRIWPKGYVFPACDACQVRTIDDEILIKLIGRANIGNQDKFHEKDFLKTVNAAKEKFPDVMRSLVIGANKKKNWFRERGMGMPNGVATSQIPMVSASHPRIAEAMEKFSTKLFCGLYYFHTGCILSKNAVIIFRWNTNAAPEELQAFTQCLVPFLSGSPQLRSQNTDLNDQFNYQFMVNSNSGIGAFICNFHSSFFVVGCIFENFDALKLQAPGEFLRLSPFIN